jgi:hypothetical protein
VNNPADWSVERRMKYIARMLARIIEEVQEPYDVDYMAPADTVLVEAMVAYEYGRIDKDELDNKAVQYLNHWRQYGKSDRS